ncbi:MAG: protein kinase [Pirellulaceae bacterium]
MNQPCNSYSDEQLLSLLQMDDGADDQVSATHLAECPHCQSRLEQMAAESDQWQDIRDSLQPDRESEEVSSSNGAKQRIDTQRRDRARWKRPNAWTESMAKSLLSPASHPELLGRIGRYDVERLIGSGGMGVVFKAYDTELNRPAAVKLLAPYLASSGSARSRFAREARAAAAVVDDHVVPIHNVETDDEHPFLVMKYIAGGSLQQRIDREGPLEVCEVLRIAMHAAKGLAAAHAQGLIHRDVKPSNILLDEGVDRALLTDFGLARAEDDACLTRSGFHPGTPHYMSPEQVRGEAIDGRSDLFSLGCVIYALCTGHPPFRSETSYAVLRRITDDTPRSIREINPNIPAWLERIVMKLLSKSREDRFESAEQIAKALEDCLAHMQHPTAIPLPAEVQALAHTYTTRNSLKAGLQHKPPIAKWVAAAGFGFSIILAGVLIVLELNKGTLTIESEADDVPIRIVQGNEIVEELTVTKGSESIRIGEGDYLVEIDGKFDGIVIDKKLVSLERRGKETVKVRMTNAQVAAAVKPPQATPVTINVDSENGLIVLRGNKGAVELTAKALELFPQQLNAGAQEAVATEPSVASSTQDPVTATPWADFSTGEPSLDHSPATTALAELNAEFRETEAAYNKACKDVTNGAEYNRPNRVLDPRVIMPAKYLAFEEEHRGTDSGLTALKVVGRMALGEFDPSSSAHRGLVEARRRVTSYYLDHHGLESLAEWFERWPFFVAESDGFLQTLVEKSPHRETRARALLAQIIQGKNLLALETAWPEALEKMVIDEEDSPQFNTRLRSLRKQLESMDFEQIRAELNQKLETLAESYSDVHVEIYGTAGEAAERLTHAINKVIVGDEAPEMTATDINGQEFRLSNLRGKIVVLLFAEHEDDYKEMYGPLRQLVAKYERAPVEFVGIMCNHDPANLLAACQGGELTWTVIPQPMPHGPLQLDWGIEEDCPVYIVDKQGILQPPMHMPFYGDGGYDARQVDERIAELLNKPAASLYREPARFHNTPTPNSAIPRVPKRPHTRKHTESHTTPEALMQRYAKDAEVTANPSMNSAATVGQSLEPSTIHADVTRLADEIAKEYGD